jgi:hypothetical protein
MSISTLAEQAVDVLTQLATHPNDPTRHNSADTLSDTVVGRLRRTGYASAVDRFTANPTAPRLRAALIDALNGQFRDDPKFRDTISALLQTAKSTPPVSEPAASNIKRIAVIAAAVVAAAGLAVGTRAAYIVLTPEPTPDGNTPCRTFFAMPSTDQRALMERIYRERNQPLRERDPYIVASVLYGCGQTPDRSVIQIVDTAT